MHNRSIRHHVMMRRGREENATNLKQTGKDDRKKERKKKERTHDTTIHNAHAHAPTHSSTRTPSSRTWELIEEKKNKRTKEGHLPLSHSLHI